MNSNFNPNPNGFNFNLVGFNKFTFNLKRTEDKKIFDNFFFILGWKQLKLERILRKLTMNSKKLSLKIQS